MRVRDKPATPTPSWLLGALLLVCGLAFIVDFLSLATYSPAVVNAPLSVWAVPAAGVAGGAVLIGIGVAAVLHSSGRVELPVDFN